MARRRARDRGWANANPNVPRGSLYLCSALTLLCAALAVSRAAVFTVDYGSEWIKVAVVSPRLKPDPIAIAINEMSKRKSPALVAITNGERLVSEEAAAIAARYPERVYSRARDLVGVPLEDAREFLGSSHAGFSVIGPSPEALEAAAGAGSVPDGRQKVWVQTHDGKVFHIAEELVGMILEYARSLSQAYAKFEVVDAVVSVPPWFSQSQRQGILDAAELVGVNVMALVHEPSAVGLQYGMFRTKELEEERDVLLYDMGGTCTYAAILHYSQYTVKERGKNVTQPQFQVKAVRWDSALGGQSLELRLLEHFSQEFNAKMGGKFDVRQLPKSMAKLKKAVKRTKEILSANTEAPISVESLYEENDFRSSISREKFEELCSDLWPRAVAPLRQVLEDAGLKPTDLYAVELVGGGTRVPKLQAVLQEFLGPNKTLDRHLDADESIALGASWLAANLSDGFKLNRRIGMVDGMPFAVQYRVQALGGSKKAGAAAVEPAEDLLFPRLKKFPLKVIRSLKSHPKDDFELTLAYEESQGLPPFWPPATPIISYHILGSKNATEKYSTYNLTSPLKTTLHFELTRNGLVLLEKAEVVVEFSEWTEVKVPIISNQTVGNTTSNATAAAQNSTQASSASPEAGGASSTAAEAQEEGKTDDASAASSAAANATEPLEEEPKFELKKKLRKRTIRVPLEVVDVTSGFQRMLTMAEVKAGQKRIDDLRAKEEEKRKTAEAKNALESYIYSTKEKLDSEDPVLLQVSTEEQRDSIKSQLLDAEDWLYMDGENAGPAEFKAKLTEIQKDAEAIFFRQKEMSQRPNAVRRAREFVEETREKLAFWKDEKPWLNETVHIQPLQEDVNELEAWLTEKEGDQKKLKDHEEPAFNSKTVINRMNSVKERVLRVERIPKPKPKKVPPPPKAKDEGAAGNGTESEAGASTEEPAADAGPEKPEHDEL